MKYTVLKTIWHTGEKKQYDPGAVVSLAHLSAAQIEKLKAMGVVEEDKTPLTQTEGGKRGADNRTN